MQSASVFRARILTPSVTMMNTGAWHRSTLNARRFQGSPRQLGIDLSPEGISDDLAATGIQNHRPVMLTICGTNEPAFRLNPQTGLPHDSGDPLVMDTIALCLQGAGHTAIPVTGECVLNAPDPLKESCVAQAGGRGGACTIIKSATGKLDHLTPPLDPAGSGPLMMKEGSL